MHLSYCGSDLMIRSVIYKWLYPDQGQSYTRPFEAMEVIVIVTVLILESSLLLPLFDEALNQGKMLASTGNSLKEFQIKRKFMGCY